MALKVCPKCDGAGTVKTEIPGILSVYCSECSGFGYVRPSKVAEKITGHPAGIHSDDPDDFIITERGG